MPGELAKATIDVHQLARADVVIALSFGAGGTGGPNRALAQIAARHSRQGHLPIICQEDVAEFLRREDGIGQVMVVPQSMHRYWHTRKVLRAAQNQFCAPRGWTNIILVAHPHMIERAAAASRKLGLSVTIAEEGPALYDVTSTQWWTRKPSRFQVWDRFAKLDYQTTQ